MVHKYVPDVGSGVLKQLNSSGGGGRGGVISNDDDRHNTNTNSPEGDNNNNNNTTTTTPNDIDIIMSLIPEKKDSGRCSVVVVWCGV